MYWITGVGGVGSFGGSAESIKNSFEENTTIENTENFSDLGIMRIAEFTGIQIGNFVKQKQDIKLLSESMKAALQAASHALLAAGLSEGSSELEEMHFYSANRGGTRLQEVDFDIVQKLDKFPEIDRSRALNELVARSYRPTEFLTQIPNLLAANVCMLRGVKGASRTIMGGQRAGACVIDMAVRALANGRAERCLVGGTNFSGCYYSNLSLHRSFFGAKDKDAFQIGSIFSSGAYYFVLETPQAAETRGARPLAEFDCVDTGQKPKLEGSDPKAWQSQANRLLFSTDPLICKVQESWVSPLSVDEITEHFLPDATINCQDAFGFLAEASIPFAVVSEVIRHREAWSQEALEANPVVATQCSLIAQLGSLSAPFFAKVTVL